MEWLVALYCRSDPETESTLDGVTIREKGWHAVSFLERENHTYWKINGFYEDRKKQGIFSFLQTILANGDLSGNWLTLHNPLRKSRIDWCISHLLRV